MISYLLLALCAMTCTQVHASQMQISQEAKINHDQQMLLELQMGTLTEEKLDEHLRNSANINAIEVTKCTALIIASLYEKLDIATWLLKRGADINAKNCYGASALSYAAKNNNIAFAELLLENGADVNTQDDEGCTPLMEIADGLNGDFRTIIKLLIKHGADLHKQDMYGNTILTTLAYNIHYAYSIHYIDYAAQQKDRYRIPDGYYEEIVELLLNADANPYIRTYDEKITIESYRKAFPHRTAEQIKQSLQTNWRSKYYNQNFFDIVNPSYILTLNPDKFSNPLMKNILIYEQTLAQKKTFAARVNNEANVIMQEMKKN